MSLFSTELQIWYNQSKRDLPWRNTNNPYFIWLSEIILQQTRVQQGMSYYYKFIEHFPSVESLSNASEQEVLNLWQGLGYYSRARNMHKTAKFISEELKGEFPSSYDGLLNLPGVGKYTAAAIASFGFGLPHAVVDGNVYRVLSRCFNIDLYIDTGDGQKYFQALADELIDKLNPAIHNQALMELGALVCVPKNPKCDVCPLNASCEARVNGNIENLPRKKSKIKVKNRTLNYFLSVKENTIFIQKRGSKDIWANMFELPLIEGDELTREILDSVVYMRSMNHKLTHQNLTVNFYQPRDQGLIGFNEEIFEVALDDLKNYPLPRVIEKFLVEELEIVVRVS